MAKHIDYLDNAILENSSTILLQEALLTCLNQWGQQNAIKSLMQDSTTLAITVCTSDPIKDDQIEEMSAIIKNDSNITKICIFANTRRDLQFAEDIATLFRNNLDIRNNNKIKDVICGISPEYQEKEVVELLPYLIECGQQHAVELLKKDPTTLELRISNSITNQIKQIKEIIEILETNQDITKVYLHVNKLRDYELAISVMKLLKDDPDIKNNNKIEIFEYKTKYIYDAKNIELIACLYEYSQYGAIECFRSNSNILELTVGNSPEQPTQMNKIIELLGDNQNITQIEFYIIEETESLKSRVRNFIELFENNQNIKNNNKIKNFECFILEEPGLLNYLYHECNQKDAVNFLKNNSKILKLEISSSNTNQIEQIKQIIEILQTDKYITEIRLVSSVSEDPQLAKNVIQLLQQNQNIKDQITNITHEIILSSHHFIKSIVEHVTEPCNDSTSKDIKIEHVDAYNVDCLGKGTDQEDDIIQTFELI